MNTKDLMIGDIVRVAKDVCIPSGTVVSIKGIDADNCFREKHLVGCATCLPKNDEYRMTCGVWVEYLEPIPLTTEILKKNKFRFNHSWRQWWHYPGSVKDGSDLQLESSNDGYELSNSTHIKVKYVHELQHLFRMAGVENEIVL